MTSSNGTFSALLALCMGNSPVSGEFPAQRPVKHSFIVFSDLRLNKRFSKQSWLWWFEIPSRSLWRHCNENSPQWFQRRCRRVSARWLTHWGHGRMVVILQSTFPLALFHDPRVLNHHVISPGRNQSGNKIQTIIQRVISLIWDGKFR